jgi:hypothetical protein
MRKRIAEGSVQVPTNDWLVLDQIAEVEVTSEDPEWPVDGALLEGAPHGWRAQHPGEQTLRIRFDEPQVLALIHIVFEEPEHERVQEFWLQWSAERGVTFRPLVRQQFSFSPAGATRQTENYAVDLHAVTDLELHLIPDVSRRPLIGTLTALRLR